MNMINRMMVTLFKASRDQNIGMIKIHVTETKIISLKQPAKNTPTPIIKKQKFQPWRSPKQKVINSLSPVKRPRSTSGGKLSATTRRLWCFSPVSLSPLS